MCAHTNVGVWAVWVRATESKVTGQGKPVELRDAQGYIIPIYTKGTTIKPTPKSVRRHPRLRSVNQAEPPGSILRIEETLGWR